MRMRRMVMAVALMAVAVGCVPAPSGSPSAPRLTITAVAQGLNLPWDIAWTPDGRRLYTQKDSGLYVHDAAGLRLLTPNQPDLWSSGETGVMGLAVHPQFSSNRRVYTCQGTTDGGNTVQVIGWQIDGAYNNAVRVQDPLIGGIDGTSGRHGGCRLEFDSAGMLYVTTGDAAVGTHPQNLGSLNGKVLRVNPANGQPAPGNPFLNAGNVNQRYVVSYGHRNVQGLAMRPGTAQVWTSEHGPNRDDEVNLIQAGRNYGWNPVPGYNESVPMTFAGATPAKWSSGSPTLATSGMTFLNGAQWKGWNGVLAVANLKSRKILLLNLAADGGFLGATVPTEFNGRFGRLRTAQQGPDGCLYVLTSNGGNDAVLRACPS
jgi:aldose sugar dehydrogenase